MNIKPIRDALALGAMALVAGELDAQCRVSQDQLLTDPAGTVGDSFGEEVAISGDVMVVGAHLDDPSAPAAGSVSVFRKQGTSWAFEATLVASNGAAADLFGRALAVESASISATGLDTVVVGAPGAEAVYIFVKSGMTWVEDSILTRAAAPVPDLQPSTSNFGDSLSLSGEVLAIGAYSDATPIFFMLGRAFVYRFDGSQWAYEDQLRRMGNGTSVAASIVTNGDQIIVSTHSTTSVTVFEQVAGDWVETDSIVAFGSVPTDSFADRMDIDDDVLIVSAPSDDAAAENAGIAYIFRRTGTGWVQEERLVGYDTSRNDRFAEDVAIDGDTAVVSAVRNNVPAEAYVFRHDGTRWVQDQQLVGDGMVEFVHLGGSVDVAGGTAVVGVNSFGIPDFSTPHCCGPGAAFVYEVGTTPSTTNCPQPFCFGDRGGFGGCTTCPCMNDAEPHTRGGCLNSNGYGARLHCLGSLSAAAADLRFEVREASPNTFGVLVSANIALPGNPMNPCFGLDTGINAPLAPLDGIRCIGGTQFRHGPRGTNDDGSIGIGSNAGWGGDDNPVGGLIQQGNFVAGQTRYWQVFYRDEIETVCMTGTNTTNGVRTLIEP